MRQLYCTPEIDVLEFKNENIVTASNGSGYIIPQNPNNNNNNNNTAVGNVISPFD